jgi:hypothetical protein
VLQPWNFFQKKANAPENNDHDLSSYFLLSALVATFSCFRFTPGLAFGEKDIGHY